jgi:uncharacterized protein (DUF1330 family)
MNQEVKKALVINAIYGTDMDAVIKYFSKLEAIFQNHGAINIQKLRTSEQIIGYGDLRFIFVVEFPNEKAIKDVFESAAFKALNSAHEKLYELFDVRICEVH